MPEIVRTVGKDSDAPPVDLQTVRVRLQDDRLSAPVAEDIVGWQGGTQREIIDESRRLEQFQGLPQVGAPAQQPGQQTPRVNHCLSRSRAGRINGVFRIVEQCSHQTCIVDAVHQNGRAIAQHRHAGISEVPGRAVFL